jgi:hypothetical protein
MLAHHALDQDGGEGADPGRPADLVGGCCLVE